jgi:hypothetical protein
MGIPHPKEAKLYQTGHDTMFHVEPMAIGQAPEGSISGIQGRHNQLRRKIRDLGQEAKQMSFIELCSRIIHK